MGTCFLLIDIWHGFFKHLSRTILFSLSAILFLHFCFVANASSYYAWYYDSNTKRVISIIKNTYEQGSFGDRKISIGNNWLFESTLNFYKETYPMDYLEKASRSEIRTDADFLYIDAVADSSMLPAIKTAYSQLCKFEGTNTLLFKKRNDPNENYTLKVENIERRELRRMDVQLKAATGKYLCDEAANNYPLWANKDIASTWETFSLIFFTENECCIRSFENKFVHVEEGSNQVYCNWPLLGSSERFIMVTDDAGSVSFKAANGKFLSLDEKSALIFAKSDSIGRLEKFKLIKL